MSAPTKSMSDWQDLSRWGEVFFFWELQVLKGRDIING